MSTVTLELDVPGLSLEGAAQRVELNPALPEEFGFDTEAELLTSALANGKRALARDTARSFLREGGRWKRVVVAEHTGSGLNLSQLVAEVGSAYSTLTVDYAIAAGGSFTIPANVRLRFLDGGRVTIANGQTVVILGELEAGIVQVFECTGTGKVVFGSTVSSVTFGPGKRVVRPEWWGAVGDARESGNGWTGTDDYDALQRCFDSTSSYVTPHVIAGVRGKRYLTGSMLAVGNANTATNVAYDVDDLIIVSNTLSGAPTVKLGDVALGRKVQGMRWHRSGVGGRGSWDYQANSVGVLVDSCDKLSLRDFGVSGHDTGFKSGAGGGNNGLFDHVFVGGCGWAAKLGPGSVEWNVFKWSGGKIESCRSGGIHLGSTGFRLENLDLSAIHGSALKLESAEGIVDTVYTEGIGTSALYSLFGQGGVGNSDKVFHVLGGNITIRNCRVNTVASVNNLGVNGNSYNNNCRWGIYLEGAYSTRIENNSFLRVGEAHVYVDANSKGTVITRDNRAQESFTLTNVTNWDGIRVVDLGQLTQDETRLMRMPGTQHGYSPSLGLAVTNAIVNPFDIAHASWNKDTGTTVAGSPIVGPDGVSNASKVVFATPAVGGSEGLGSGIRDLGVGGLNGKTIVARGFMRLIAQGSPIAGREATDGPIPLLVVTLGRPPIGGTPDLGQFSIVPALGGEWTFFDFRFQPPTHGGNEANAYFAIVPQYIPLELGLYGVELFAVDNKDAHVPYDP